MTVRDMIVETRSPSNAPARSVRAAYDVPFREYPFDVLAVRGHDESSDPVWARNSATASLTVISGETVATEDPLVLKSLRFALVPSPFSPAHPTWEFECRGK